MSNHLLCSGACTLCPLYVFLVVHAYSIWRHMEEYGPAPNMYTYNNIVRAFAEAGLLEESLSILDRIKQRGFVPDIYTFTTLLMACGRSNRSEKVNFVLDTMKQFGIAPDEIGK
jgi:pentatricopeptide repeat protein